MPYIISGKGFSKCDLGLLVSESPRNLFKYKNLRNLSQVYIQILSSSLCTVKFEDHCVLRIKREFRNENIILEGNGSRSSMESREEKGRTGIRDHVGFMQEMMTVETRVEAGDMKRTV